MIKNSNHTIVATKLNSNGLVESSVEFESRSEIFFCHLFFSFTNYITFTFIFTIYICPDCIKSTRKTGKGVSKNISSDGIRSQALSTKLSPYPAPPFLKSLTEEEVEGPDEDPDPDDTKLPLFFVFKLATWLTKSDQTIPLKRESLGSLKSLGWISPIISSRLHWCPVFALMLRSNFKDKIKGNV